MLRHAKEASRAAYVVHCRKIVLKSDPEFPFCSERCRVIDLGKWASGDYVISSPLNDPETDDFSYPTTMTKSQTEPAVTQAPAPRWATLVATFFGAGRLRPGPGHLGIVGRLPCYGG